MPTTSDLKKGVRIQLDGEPYTVVESNTQTPSARGAATLVKVKLRNLKTKQLLSKTFKAGERLDEPDFEIRPCQYLYDEGGELFYFMDNETYEQHAVSREDMEYEMGFVLPGDSVRTIFFQGECIGIEVPNTVVLEVTECEPAIRGDTVTRVTKTAKLQTGIEVQVPLFISQGEKLVIDTRDCRYVRRA